jgi:hypothetical protein
LELQHADGFVFCTVDVSISEGKMAQAVRLIHPQTGLTKTGYFGFSWTSFFFSGIPAITRGDVGIGLGVLLGTIVLGALSFGLLGFVVNIIWSFVYNKMYTTKLIEAGYRIEDTPEVAGKAKAALGMAVG